MRSLAVVAAAGFVLMSLACGGGVRRPAGEALTDDRELARFVDSPEQFKGKTIRAAVNVRSLPTDGGTTLRDCAGKPVWFYSFLTSGPMLQIQITMPADKEKIPNAVAGDKVIVAFTCGGKLDDNRADSIARP